MESLARLPDLSCPELVLNFNQGSRQCPVGTAVANFLESVNLVKAECIVTRRAVAHSSPSKLLSVPAQAAPSKTVTGRCCPIPGPRLSQDSR
jgi:hypothetical protein